MKSFELDIFTSRAARRRTLGSITVLLIGFVIGWLTILRTIPWVLDPEVARTYVKGFGGFAPIVFILLQVVQVVLAPIPGQLVGITGGYLFGPILGTLYSMIGVTIGSFLVILAARKLGRPAVERWIRDEVLQVFDGWVQEGGIPVLFLLYLLPTFPDDALCALAGLTTIRIRTLVALVVIGRTPSFFLVAFAGSQFAQERLVKATVILGAIGIVSLLVYHQRRRIRLWVAH